jgi:two-component sensor histidine kinase
MTRTDYSPAVAQRHAVRPLAAQLIYSRAMTPVLQSRPRGIALMFSWSRVRVVLAASILLGLLNSIDNETATVVVLVRAIIVGTIALAAFGIIEQWPARLPTWLARSALQVVAVAIVIPPGAAIAYWATVRERPTGKQERQLLVAGYAALTFTGILFAPWIAVGALLKQRDAFAREQALSFDVERSELERSARNARLRLLQAQVEPHFLFNTLANVQALVDAGSPQASKVLTSLIAYLRAAVPRMHEAATTLGDELELVRAYLELMQMRMPDRLQFALRIDPEAKSVQCPPMTLLTLVENSVRHGIDPGEEGGRIDVDVMLRDSRCFVRVSDTGLGFESGTQGLGTGLSTLRERLQLTFGADAQLRLLEVQPHGVCAEVSFPARRQPT